MNAPYAETRSSTVIAVSPEEVARLLGIGKTLLYEQLMNGALSSIKIGKRRVIQMSAIEEFLTRKKNQCGWIAI